MFPFYDNLPKPGGGTEHLVRLMFALKGQFKLAYALGYDEPLFQSEKPYQTTSDLAEL